MSSYRKDGYDLGIESLYDVFSDYTKEEIDFVLSTFQKSYVSMQLLRKKYGMKLDGTELLPNFILTFIEKENLLKFLSLIDLRLKCISYLSKQGKSFEDIKAIFKDKTDVEIYSIIKKISETMSKENEDKKESADYENKGQSKNILSSYGDEEEKSTSKSKITNKRFIAYKNKDKILEALNISEDELEEAINLIRSMEKRMCYIYSYGINRKQYNIEQICDMLKISKVKYKKYIEEVQKELPKLVQKVYDGKKSHDNIFVSPINEEIPAIKEDVTTQKEEKTTKVQLKKAEVKVKEIITQSIEELTDAAEIAVVEIKVDEITTFENNITTQEVEKITPEGQAKEKEEVSSKEDDRVTQSIEEQKDEAEIKVEEVKEKAEPKIEIIEVPTEDIYTLLVSLYVDEIDLEEVEKANIDPFDKSILLLAFYDKNNDIKIANLYISYLQERYKNNKQYLMILNEIMLMINDNNHSFDVDVYENLLKSKTQNDEISDQEKEEVLTSEITNQEVIEKKDEIEEELLQSVTLDNSIVEISNECNTIGEDLQEEIDNQDEMDSIKNATIEEKKEVITICPKALKDDMKLQRIEKKHIITIRDVLYDDIIKIEKELYVKMQDLTAQRRAIKAWDILENMTSKSIEDKDALNKVICFLRRVDNEYTPKHIKGLQFSTNYQKYMK